ncbi:MAG: hypothetical protein J2P20_20825, partial [Pseudonocardia sp.]|nr:hypothetical protein [Pseudonocardia sp.]
MPRRVDGAEFVAFSKATPSPGEGAEGRLRSAAMERLGGGQRRIRIAVVFGGRSSEHAISC